MTIIYENENNILKREETNDIDFKQGWVSFNEKEINVESLVRIEE
jgi:hypothetical protein